jgi:two-component system, OmpR family, sensor histidine kinase BaeS
VRRRLTAPPRPLPSWWPPDRPWPPVEPTRSASTPGWWPQGEPWPPPDAASRSGGSTRFPIRIAILFAIGLNLIVAGAVALVRAVAAPFGVGPLGSTPLWSVGVTLVAATAWLFVVAMRRVGTPVSDIVVAADRVAEGDLSVRLDERGLPWLGRVAHAFNTMTLRLERQQRDRRALMADIAHELRTPLAVIQGRMEGMLDGVYPRDEPQIRQVLNETRTLARLVEDLRTSAHLESGTLTLQKEATDLGVLLEEMAQMFRPEAEARRVSLDVQAGDLPLLTVDPLRIREVLANLLSNAIRYSPDSGAVRIIAQKDRDEIVVRVVDQGPGILPEDLPKIFERFQKGPTSHGSGIGLSIARSLVAAHGGTIRADSGSEGTTMTFTVPLNGQGPIVKSG